MDEEFREFLNMFFEEAGENLATLESGLLRLETAVGDDELLNAVFRAAHSIKGGAASFGLDDVARFAHVMEGLLDQFRRGERRVTTRLADVLLRATDQLKDLMQAARAGEPAPPGVARSLSELEEARANPLDIVPVAPAAAGASAAVDAPAAAKAPTGEPKRRRSSGRGATRTSKSKRVAARPSAEVPAPAAVPPAPAAGEPLTDLPPDKAEIWDETMLVETAGVAARVAPLPLAAPSPPPARGPLADAGPRADGLRRRVTDADVSASIRVSVEKVDKLVNLVGELVISQSIVTQTASDFTPARLVRLMEALADVERNTRELQEQVMSIRMVPIATVFHRFNRVVRDLAAQTGKKILLQLQGEETELDKGVIELLSDPLTHLVRNAADHGLETEQERDAAGKPPAGMIRLAASTEGGVVSIEVVDDGRGLDREKIREKAIERGLLRPEDDPTEEQVFSMIFQPGFSTAATVTDVSGRGVGMDVVRRNIEKLNGTVTVQSRPGKGSRIVLKLPLTMAILDGLTVSLAGNLFILPLASVVESIRPGPDEIRPVLAGGEVVLLRGQTIPLLRTSRLLGLDHAGRTATGGLAVMVEHDKQLLALMVDEVKGQQQVVIKNLEANYKRVEGTMGATIMGDGRVALILDVPGLARLHARREAPAETVPPSPAALAA